MKIAWRFGVTFSDPITLSGPVDYITDEGFTLFHGLTQRNAGNVKATISNSIAHRIVELYEQHGFRLHNIPARRSISCKSSTREIARDLVAVLEVVE